MDSNRKEEFALCQDHLIMIQNDYQKQFDEYENKLAEYEKRLTQFKSLAVHVPDSMPKQNESRGDISLDLHREPLEIKLHLDSLNKNKEPLGIEAILRDSLDE